MRKLILAASIAMAAAMPAAASANGPCGQNFDGNHACGITSPAFASGSLVTDNESDYYIFHAQKGTELSVSITDTENPGCSTVDTGNSNVRCGAVRVSLTDAQGNEIESAGDSYPYNGITVPASLSHTLDTKGTYYLIVRGHLEVDSNGNPAAVPYTLGVSASPGVVWPPPRPYTYRHCTTRKVWRYRRHHRRVRVKITTCHTVTVYP